MNKTKSKLKTWEIYATYQKDGKGVVTYFKIEAENQSDAKLHMAEQILKDIGTRIITIKEIVYE